MIVWKTVVVLVVGGATRAPGKPEIHWRRQRVVADQTKPTVRALVEVEADDSSTAGRDCHADLNDVPIRTTVANIVAYTQQTWPRIPRRVVEQRNRDAPLAVVARR